VSLEIIGKSTNRGWRINERPTVRQSLDCLDRYALAVDRRGEHSAGAMVPTGDIVDPADENIAKSGQIPAVVGAKFSVDIANDAKPRHGVKVVIPYFVEKPAYRIVVRFVLEATIRKSTSKGVDGAAGGRGRLG